MTKQIKNKTIDFNFIAMFFVVMITTTISFTSIIFLIGGTINKWLFVLTYLLSIFLTYKVCGKTMNKDDFKRNIIISTLIFAILCIFSLVFYDSSWDGNVYHKQMIGLMKNGMNPLYNEVSGDIWSRHYANGSEIWGAVLYAFFDNIEVGKVINLLLAFTLYVVAFNYSYKKSTKKVFSNLFAFALAFNPILINQFHSYYIDGIVANSLFLCIIFLLNIIDGKQDIVDKKQYLMFLSSIIICTNAKFTALLLCIMFCGLLGIYIVISNIKNKNYIFIKKFIIFMVISFLFSVLVVGSSTYVKNFVKNGNPFYPLMGEGAVDIESGNEPDSFKNLNHVEKWIYATFSETYTWYNKKPTLKIPFSVSQSELDSLAYPDIRIGGLGVWFSGLLVISTIVIIFTLIKLFLSKSKYFWIIGLLMAGIVLPIPILPVVWQARYYPEIYLIPFIAIMCISCSKNKFINILSYIIVLLAVGNSLFMVPQAYDKLQNSIKINKTLINLSELSQTKKITISQDNYTFYGTYYNYIDKKINYTYSEEKLKDGIPFYYGALYKIEGGIE